MDDYGISEILPKLSQEKIEELNRLLKKLGVEDESDLKEIKEDDLTKDNHLNTIQARKLIRGWKKS